MTGCGTPPTPAKPAPVQIESNLDPCAEGLHDLEGKLLEYYAAYGELPPRLEDIAKVDTITLPQACPVTRRAYVYNPEGVELPGLPGLLVVYEQASCNGRTRWGIMIEPPKPGKAIVPHLVNPPDTAFKAAGL